MDKRFFSEKVVEWYESNKRALPWRTISDPYKIWLSEIILQQTRVNQGIPYYLRFVEAFPDVFSLASAKEETVLRFWQGLGYYSRARNLHKCAKVIVEDHNGIFPASYAELLKLPGIGEYTAAAIASICFGEAVAVVDGNVFRVLSRIFGVHLPINSPEGRKEFFRLAATLIHPRSPDLYNQGLMEFGALWCSPRLPKCEQCVFKQECFAYNNKLQGVLPAKNKSAKAKTRYFYYFVFKKGKSLLMKCRRKNDIWKGLYDFYLVEKKRSTKPELLLAEKATAGEKKISYCSPAYKHVLSHQKIVSRFIVIEEDTPFSAVEEEPLKYYSLSKIESLPKPVLISRFLKDYNFL